MGKTHPTQEVTKKMTKNNTPEVTQKVLNKLMDDLLKEEYCSRWNCDECPCYLRTNEEDFQSVPYKCGWLLLKSVTSKIVTKR